MSQRNSRDTTQTNKQTKNKQNTSAEDFTGNDTEQECKRKRPRPRSNSEREKKKQYFFFFQNKTTVVALLFFFLYFFGHKKMAGNKRKKKGGGGRYEKLCPLDYKAMRSAKKTTSKSNHSNKVLFLFLWPKKTKQNKRPEKPKKRITFCRPGVVKAKKTQ